jgi:hypothetical protein
MKARRHYLQLRVLVSVMCLALFLGFGQLAQACPSCQRALADGSQGNLAAGIYYSVLFMLSMPFAIVGSFGLMAYRAVKREQRRVAEEEARRQDAEQSDSDV